MVGLGETDDEVLDAMRQLRGAGVELLTLGQYLSPGRPGTRFLPVDRFVPPEQFDEWKAAGHEMGFLGVASGPLVRSSYRAGLLMEEAERAKSALAVGTAMLEQ
jgi:lipoic acid synthetase